MLKDSFTNDNSLKIFLSETWLSKNIMDAEVNLEGFSLFRETGKEGPEEALLSMSDHCSGEEDRMQAFVGGRW